MALISGERRAIVLIMNFHSCLSDTRRLFSDFSLCARGENARTEVSPGIPRAKRAMRYAAQCLQKQHVVMPFSHRPWMINIVIKYAAECCVCIFHEVIVRFSLSLSFSRAHPCRIVLAFGSNFNLVLRQQLSSCDK